MITTYNKIIIILILLLFIFSSDNYSQDKYSSDIIYSIYKPLIDRTISIISEKDIDIQSICDSIKLIDSIHTKSEERDFRFYQILDRKLECGLKQFYFVKSFFYLNILFDNDTIVLISFYNDNLGSLFEYRDKNRFQSFTKIHENNYNVKFSKKDTFLLPFKCYEYGVICGLGGIPTEIGLDMLKLVKKKKYKILRKWSLAMNPEIQAYGVMGLIFLQYRGYKLSKEDIDNINRIKKQPIELSTCQGCSIYVKNQMNIELSDENIRSNYEYFTLTGWLDDR